MLADTSAFVATTGTSYGDDMTVSAHAAATTGLPDAKARSSIICWNCKGIGHFMNECPSPKIDRSYTEVISLLASHIEKQLPPLAEKEPKPILSGRTEQAHYVGFVDVHNQHGDEEENNSDGSDTD